MKFRTDGEAMRFLTSRIADDTIHITDRRTITRALDAAERLLDPADYLPIVGQVFMRSLSPLSRLIPVIDGDPAATAAIDRALCQDTVRDDGVRPLYDGTQYLSGAKH